MELSDASQVIVVKWRNGVNPNAKCLIVSYSEISILSVKTVQKTEIQMFSFGFKLI